MMEAKLSRTIFFFKWDDGWTGVVDDVMMMKVESERNTSKFKFEI